MYELIIIVCLSVSPGIEKCNTVKYNHVLRSHCLSQLMAIIKEPHIEAYCHPKSRKERVS